jgi:hypothetical protein
VSRESLIGLGVVLGAALLFGKVNGFCILCNGGGSPALPGNGGPGPWPVTSPRFNTPVYYQSPVTSWGADASGRR